ncbi:hypothetical protein NBT05_12855 [Aquimarina sp. ERC-38]|uniref:hypothetical protein n=1 Tax=Aquimarina sp. ERC-38 TaxID=2949996 RepID=UPI0022466226|nr:hypothetical protein [Aquimarina sp. ERC-38]UZO79839.1 hypothetical protein NBT05_12855 [Aquimarina sp. ERC-38]
MGLLILSTRKVTPEESIASIASLSLKNGFKFHMEEVKDNSKNYVDLYIAKHYKKDEEEYFYLELRYDQMKIIKNNKLYNRLGVTDQTDYPRLMYDFSLEYLRLNPDHCISFHRETFFFLKDMEDIESGGGYFDDWCFENPNDQL